MKQLTPGLVSLLLLCLGAAGHGHADGWLGIYLDDKSDAPRVLEVIPDSPAARAGLRPGDVIVAMDGAATTTRAAFVTAVRDCKVGQRVNLRLDRDGKEVQVVVQLGERPPDGGVPPRGGAATERPGTPPPQPRGESAPPAVRVQPRSNPEPRHGYLGASIGQGNDGVEVGRVLEGSPAATAGLQAGDVLLRWEDREVESLAQLDELVGHSKPGQRIALEVHRGDAKVRLSVTLGVRPGSVGQDDGPARPTPAPPARPVDVELPFLTDFAAAEAQAKASGRAMLIVYGASWDGSSQAQRRAFAAPELQPALGAYVCVYVDADQNRDLLAARKIVDLPVIEVVREGAVQWRNDGFVPLATLQQRLAADPRALAPRGDRPARPAAPAAPAAPPAPIAPTPAGASEAQVREEMQLLRREVEELRRLLEELRRARSGGE